MIELEFAGAARTVTGSKHVVRTSSATLLLDCGLWQGRRRESIERNRHLRVDPNELDAVVLSHAHIDHSGALPLLVKQGFDGPIYATPATRDLCAVMLVDAALIQAADARHVNRAIDRDGLDMERVEPLFTEDDVVRALDRFVDVPYHRPQRVGEGAQLTFLDAGHVLGSAICVLDLDDEGARRRIAFTGDLGRHHMPILRDPEIPHGVEVLIMESTYGDRTHAPMEEVEETLSDVVRRTAKRGGKVIIPSFALERAQEIVYALKRLSLRGHLPKIPVYVDSPLTVKITDVFRMHPECFDETARSLLRSPDSPFEFADLTYVSERVDSQALDASPDPSVIISASGMCEAGRVLHHLQATVEDPKNTVVIVGFQAEHTLGRRIVERRPKIRIFGIERELRAEVVVMNGFSAHADSNDLVSFAASARDRGPLRNVVLVHGEQKAQEALRSELVKRQFPDIRIPELGEKIRL